jgi:hypothetical protein
VKRRGQPGAYRAGFLLELPGKQRRHSAGDYSHGGGAD